MVAAFCFCLLLLVAFGVVSSCSFCLFLFASCAAFDAFGAFAFFSLPLVVVSFLLLLLDHFAHHNDTVQSRSTSEAADLLGLWGRCCALPV